MDPLGDLFQPERIGSGREGSADWHREAFYRAYCGAGGPFTQACTRLRLGFSVLVYLPGNCMAAAADYVKANVEPRAWEEYGKHPGSGGIQDVWSGSSKMVGSLKAWLKNSPEGRAHAIYHNLNQLSDGRGALHSSLEAQTAFFSLTETTRAGVVLALSDRDAGKLPEPIEQIFAERVWIEEIAVEAFRRLIPVTLGQRLADKKGELPDGAAWLLASRLRWTDPIRAVKILRAVADHLPADHPPPAALREALDQVWRATRAIGFLDPDRAFPDDEIKGFQAATLELLRNDVAGPFEAWRDFTGTREECERMIRRLPPGLILHGPPGTGKTYLARWLARKIGLPVRLVNATDIKEPLFGRAEENVHRLFREARRAAPCMIVLDDADDLLQDRNTAEGAVAGAERSIVNAFLQELEGFEGRSAGVLVVMTTNQFDRLDRAVCSRLGLHVRIPFPLDDAQVREIVEATARQEGLELDAEIETLLAGRFFRTVRSDPSARIETAAERLKVQENLFDAREIQQAMRRLVRAAAGHQIYRPDRDDVARMERYYDRP